MNVQCKSNMGLEQSVKISVTAVAKMMNMEEESIYQGLREGCFEWGSAVESKYGWRYYIDPSSFFIHLKVDKGNLK